MLVRMGVRVGMLMVHWAWLPWRYRYRLSWLSRRSWWPSLAGMHRHALLLGTLHSLLSELRDKLGNRHSSLLRIGFQLPSHRLDLLGCWPLTGRREALRGHRHWHWHRHFLFLSLLVLLLSIGNVEPRERKNGRRNKSVAWRRAMLFDGKDHKHKAWRNSRVPPNMMVLLESRRWMGGVGTLYVTAGVVRSDSQVFSSETRPRWLPLWTRAPYLSMCIGKICVVLRGFTDSRLGFADKNKHQNVAQLSH